MAKKNETPITCTVEYTDGAEQRITDGLVDLVYWIRDGIYEGPLLKRAEDENTA